MMMLGRISNEWHSTSNIAANRVNSITSKHHTPEQRRCHEDRHHMQVHTRVNLIITSASNNTMVTLSNNANNNAVVKHRIATSFLALP